MGLRMIGAGYGRTGTASLKLALERLGVGPCHHMSEVLPSAERVGLWTRIGEGEAVGDPRLWEAAFAGYAATVDWPACTHWRALMERWPEAKVILTRRDAGSWFESVNATILKPSVCAALARTPMGGMLEANIWRLFGGRMDDREHMIACFERHCAEVGRGVPADRLLVYESGQGWGPLCRFLGMAEPDEAYPRVNAKEETAKLMADLEHQIAGGAVLAEQGFAEDIYRGGKGSHEG